MRHFRRYTLADLPAPPLSESQQRALLAEALEARETDPVALKAEAELLWALYERNRARDALRSQAEREERRLQYAKPREDYR